MSYWQNFYKKYSVTDAPTDFAKFTLDLIPQYIKKPFSQISLVDIACGNARDTIFFRTTGIEALGIDLFSNSTDLPYVSKKNAMDLKVKNDVYYLRFFLHAIKEEEADRVLMNLSKIMVHISARGDPYRKTTQLIQLRNAKIAEMCQISRFRDPCRKSRIFDRGP